MRVLDYEILLCFATCAVPILFYALLKLTFVRYIVQTGISVSSPSLFGMLCMATTLQHFKFVRYIVQTGITSTTPNMYDISYMLGELFLLL